jgi:hypothetical protein
MRDFGKADKQYLWWPSYLDDGQEHLATTTDAHLAPLVGSEGLPSISAVPKVESPTIYRPAICRVVRRQRSEQRLSIRLVKTIRLLDRTVVDSAITFSARTFLFHLAGVC